MSTDPTLEPAPWDDETPPEPTHELAAEKAASVQDVARDAAQEIKEGVREHVMRASEERAELIEDTDGAPLPAAFQPDTFDQLLEVRDPDTIRQGVGVVRASLLARVRDMVTSANVDLPAEVKTPTDVRSAVTRLADAADLLTGLGSAFTAAGKEATTAAGEYVAMVPPSRGPVRASLRVGDGHGRDLVITVPKTSELKVSIDEVVDVIAAQLVGAAVKGAGDGMRLGETRVTVYAEGVRAGIAAFRDLLTTTPPFRSTSLDLLVHELEGAGEDDLARRLQAAYGKVEKGEGRAKIDRLAPTKPKGAK